MKRAMNWLSILVIIDTAIIGVVLAAAAFVGVKEAGSVKNIIGGG